MKLWKHTRKWGFMWFLHPCWSLLRHLSAVQEIQVQSLSREDPLKKEMATHSSILAWRTPGTEDLGGLQSMGSQRVGYDWVTNTHTHTHTHTHTYTHMVCIPILYSSEFGQKTISSGQDKIILTSLVFMRIVHTKHLFHIS